MSRLTIKDVAKAAGVSFQTVSLVLNICWIILIPVINVLAILPARWELAAAKGVSFSAWLLLKHVNWKVHAADE